MRDKQKKEAVKRLEIMISQGIITDLDIVGNFTKSEQLYFSEPMILLGEIIGVIHPLTASERYSAVVQEFREEHENLLPYFVLSSNTVQFGWIVSILFVSNDEKEWNLDKEELINKTAIAYCYNIDDAFSEVGFIDYDIFMGGPVRIG